MQSARSVVNLLLDNQNVRVCAHCAAEHGQPEVEPGQSRSHGICRRHAGKMADELQEPARSRYLEKLKLAPDSGFCPDMAAPPV